MSFQNQQNDGVYPPQPSAPTHVRVEAIVTTDTISNKEVSSLRWNWTHVADGLPDLMKPVLLTDGKIVLVGERVEERFYLEKRGRAWRWIAVGVSGYEWDWDFNDILSESDPVTHWMPLPEPPNETRAG